MAVTQQHMHKIATSRFVTILCVVVCEMWSAPL